MAEDQMGENKIERIAIHKKKRKKTAEDKWKHYIARRGLKIKEGVHVYAPKDIATNEK